MNKKNMQALWGSLIGALALCIVIFYFLVGYISKDNNKTVQSVGGIYMDEMSTQLQQHFKSIIELRLDMVEGIVSRTPPESYSEYCPEMIEQLKYNGQTRNFDFLALYTADGSMEIIYGEPVTILGEQAFLESLNADDSKLAQAKTASGNELLMMGVSVIYPMEGQKICTALIAGIDLEYIDYAMSLGGDKSLCYSHIIRKDGDFVIRTSDNDYINTDNYFEYLLQCQGNEEDIKTVIDGLQSAMQKNEEYSTSVYVENGMERRQLYCVPLIHSEWYLVSVMPHGKLDEAVQAGSSRRVIVSVGSCLAVILLMLTIFILYYRMSIHQMEQLTQARLEAEEANKAKSRFLSNMSHDIRTPMNAIVGMTTIAQDNIDNPEQVHNCLNKISISSKHLLGLINDVLDMSKIESGKMVLNRDLLSLREEIDNIVTIIQPQVKTRQQFFDVYIQEIQTERVYCDGSRLNQILLNLLSNAIKFTPDKGRITMTISQEDSPKGGEYVRTHFWVKDTGIGMSEEFQKKAFDTFVREDNTRIHKVEGTGLGLAITKHIVDTAEGTIELKSVPDKGTEFHVILDLRRASTPNSDMLLPQWDILVVDDDELLCQSAARSLNEIGANAEWVLDGAAAIQMAEERHKQSRDYHVILLDWQMPGMDGIETARELHRLIGEDIPLLLISAYDWGEIEEEARAAGIDGFISKPLFKSTLFYGLSQYVSSGKTRIEIPSRPADDYTGRRLLIAEDNDLNWEIADELLSSVGFIVERAENGEQCADGFRSHEIGYYDAILMDLRMPVMDGYEATKAIRSMDRQDAGSIPIIAMTADAFSEDIQKCLDCGMNAHTAKPLDMQELLRLLQRYFSN